MAAGYQSLPQSRGKPFFFELNTDNAVYEGYHPETPRGFSRCCCCPSTSRSTSQGQAPTSTCCSCLPSRCDALSFKDWETEALYQQFAYAFRRALLCRLLLLHSLLLACMCGLDIIISPRRLSFKTLAFTGLLTIHLLLFVHLNCRLMRRQHLPVLTVLTLLLLLLAVGISLPVEWKFLGQANLGKISEKGVIIQADRGYAIPDGLWIVSFIILCIYAFAPIGMYVSMPFCGALSTLHLTIAALVPKVQTSNYWRMLGSNCVVLFAVNLVGLLIHRGQERQLRQIFTDTRDCITNRIAYQEESDKLEQLCAVVAPEPLISDLRRDFLSMTESSTSARGTNTSAGANPSGRFPLVINHLRNISFMSCDMLPITNFPPDFAASEAVRLLNEVYGRFDQLAQEYSCFRVYMHSEQYLCICGYPDTRMDHAKSSVELAFAILEQINNLSDSTELGIDIRLAVHTGDAYANILGKTRLAFDLTGDDASIAKQLHSLCAPGRVLVSKATFDQLPDGYRAESGPLLDLAPTPDGRSTRVETYYIKPRHYRSSSNLRGAGGGGPRRARYTRLQALEPTQKRSGLVRITQCAKFNASSPYMFLAEDLQKQCVKLRDSEEFVRKPFKRKSVTAWTVSLQRYMALTVNGPSGDGNAEESPVRSVRSLSMNPFTLRFHDPVEERGYHANEDWTFGRCMVTALCLLLASAALQAVIFPRTVLLLLLFMIAFTWIGMMLLVILVTKLRCLEFNVQSSAVIRLVVIITSVLFIYAVSQVNVFCCHRPPNNSTVAGAAGHTTVSPTSGAKSGLLAPSTALMPSHLTCDLPQYLPLSCVLSLLVLVAFMSLPAIGKVPLSILVFTSYTVVIEVTHKILFDRYDLQADWNGLPGHAVAIMCMALFVVFVYIQGRFMEYTLRLGHLWRSQARANMIEAERFRECSELVLKNVLPEHVALYFLDNTYRNPIGLYSQDYGCLGVLCASVPTWQVGGDATIHEDIRRLNDLIVQFDDLLNQEKYAPLDKVRALFNGYVTVVGVNPLCLLQDNTSKMQYLTLLVQYAMSMKRIADETNSAMGVNRMKMRIGIHAGSGFSGVIGAHRPGFDLWGEAFQLAAILERCGVLQQIHVSPTVVTFTQAQFDFMEHAQLPLPSPAPAGSNLTSFVLCESQRHGARMHNKRYSVPCNSQPAPPAALPSHTSHSVSRSAMRAVRQNSLNVAAPLPVVPGISTPPMSHQPLPSHPEQDQHIQPHQQHHHNLPSNQQHQALQNNQQHHQQVHSNQSHPHQMHNIQQHHPQQPNGQQHHQQLPINPQQLQNGQQHIQQLPMNQQHHHQLPSHSQHHQQPLQAHHRVPNNPHHQQPSQQFVEQHKQFPHDNNSHHSQQMPIHHQQFQNQAHQPQQQFHHHPNQQHHQQMQNHHPYQNQPFPPPQQQPFMHPQQQFQQMQQAAQRQPSAPHTPASEVAPSLPPRPSNPVGSEMAAENRLPAKSNSSLNSFLQMEDACSSVPRPGLMVGDHYNPLYTDNEYDTDMDAAFATRPGPAPQLSPNPRPGSDSSTGLHGRGSGDGNSPGISNLVHQLDFPDYQRPASPGGPPSLSGGLPSLSAPAPRSQEHQDVDEASLPLGTETLDSVMTQDDGPGLVFTLSGSGRGVRLKPTGRGGGRARRRGADTEDEVEEVEESDLESNLDQDRRLEADSELEAVRLQSDLASELSDQLFVSDIEDAVGERLYRFPAGNRMAQRPTTLPDVAPVGLPDFSLLGGPMQPDCEEEVVEDNEDERHRLREAAALERRRERFRGGPGRRAAAGSPSVRSEYDNMCSESDAGYTGDVASSAYEEDSCDDDEDSDLDYSGHFRAALRRSDYDNMAAAMTGMMDVNNVFNEQIAEEARRISHVFQQQQWNGVMDTATSQGEEEEGEADAEEDHGLEDEEDDEGVTEVANAAPHEDGGESPMSLPPELSKSETLVALLGTDPHHHLHDDEAPLSMTSSFSEVATTSEVGESEYDNYESDNANGELSSSSWFTGFPLHQFEHNPPSSGGTGGAGSNTRTTVV